MLWKFACGYFPASVRPEVLVAIIISQSIVFFFTKKPYHIKRKIDSRNSGTKRNTIELILVYTNIKITISILFRFAILDAIKLLIRIANPNMSLK